MHIKKGWPITAMAESSEGARYGGLALSLVVNLAKVVVCARFQNGRNNEPMKRIGQIWVGIQLD